jgi:hypothetical protein
MTQSAEKRAAENPAPGTIRRNGTEPGASVCVLPVPGAKGAEGRRPLRIRHGHIQLFGRDISTPLILLAMAEALVFATAFFAAVQFIFPGGAQSAPAFFEALPVKVAAFVGLNMLAMLSMGLYRRGMRDSLVQLGLRLAGAFALGGVMLAVLFYMLPNLILGRGVMVVAMGLAFGGVLLTRLLGVRLLHLDAFKRRVLVIGAGSTAGLFSRLRRRSDRHGFELTGFVAQPNEQAHVDPRGSCNWGCPWPCMPAPITSTMWSSLWTTPGSASRWMN